MKDIYIGLMSGTSVDGLDVAIVDFTNEEFKLLFYKEYDYTEEVAQEIFNAINNESTSKDICELNVKLADIYSDCINDSLKEAGLTPKDIKGIGTHGQTIWHTPKPKEGEYKSTLQIVDGSTIAQKTNIDTVSDFRMAHLSAGGEGAPLVPFGDKKLFSSKDKDVLTIWQNIGGMSNSSLIDNSKDDVISFDNGPGNVIINYISKRLFNVEYDCCGKEARNGKIIDALIKELLEDDYYTMPLPKTTGREKYTSEFCEKIISTGHGKHDLLRTMTYFTAMTIADSYKRYLIIKDKKYEVIVSGGGAYNKLMMEDIKKELSDLPNVSVFTSEEKGYNSSAKEAVIFAYFAMRTLNRKHSAVIDGKKVVLGKVSYKNNYE